MAIPAPPRGTAAAPPQPAPSLGVPTAAARTLLLLLPCPGTTPLLMAAKVVLLLSHGTPAVVGFCSTCAYPSVYGGGDVKQDVQYVKNMSSKAIVT